MTVATFLTCLPGTWHLERRISVAGHESSHFQGLAHIRPTDVRGTYSFHEEGSFVNERVRQEAYRDYIYKAKGKTLDILFADPHRMGQPFVSLDFSQGVIANDTHVCGQDIYALVFEIISTGEFHTETIVSGPEKDYRLETIYRRI